MARTRVLQDQIQGSVSYDDAVASAHTVGVAEAQTTVQGDLNVIRTILKDLVGETNWYDTPDVSVQDVYDKYFISREHVSGFDGVTLATGGTSTAFDTAIKTITTHASGAGDSSTEGVILDATKAHRVAIRDANSGNAIDDGGGNEVYGRLSAPAGTYTLTWYSLVSGTETAYSFTTTPDVDLAFVLVSRPYQNLPWDRFIDPSFHDVAGVIGSVADDNVSVDGMSDLLSGLTTQATVNAKLDDLGSTTASEGASLVAIADGSAYYTGTDVEAALNEIEAQIGGATSTTFGFTEDNVLADNDAVYAALDKLDLKWGDLATADTAGLGADLVAINDSASGFNGFFTGADVQTAMEELVTLFGSTTSGTFGFTEDNVLADNDAVYAALDKLDLKWGDLANTANGEGAALVGVEDASSYYTGTDLETVLNEIETQIGGATSTTFNFTEANVLADNDALYAALEKLDLKWGDLGSTANTEGASLVAIEDASTWYTGTDVEAALNELESLPGSTTSTTYSFGENNVLADNDAVYAALNKLDLKWGDLASTANGEGAALVSIEDASTWYTGTTVEVALNEIEALFGATNSTTYSFGENNVLADNDAVYAALNKLDLKWGDLASTANGEGAALVSIEDANAKITATDVEGAIEELYDAIQDVSAQKETEALSGDMTSGVNHTLPGSLTYTLASGDNLDVYANGVLLYEGASNDYLEVAGGTQINPNWTIPSGTNMAYFARK